MVHDSLRNLTGGSDTGPGVGDEAPAFELRRTFEETVTSSELLLSGPVLLVFYVFDFGHVWGDELSQLGQLTPRIRELGAEPVAIAVTATFSQMAFSKALGVDFPMLSDWEGEVAHRYGVQYEVWKGHSGLAKRSVFVIGTDGKIVYRWVTDDALTLPDLEEALAVLQSLSPTPAEG